MLPNTNIRKYALALVVVGIASFIGLAQKLNTRDSSLETQMSDSGGHNEHLLDDLSKSKFQKATFPQTDALVAIVAEGEDLPAEVRQTLDDAGDGRSYPFEGGWKITCPYFDQEYNHNLFTIEEGGWDHGHCDVCFATIKTGDSCWVDYPENDYILCGDCYQKLKP